MISQLELLEPISYNNLLSLNGDDIKNIREYCEFTKTTFDEVCGIALREKINRERKYMDKYMALNNMSDSELKQSKIRGSAIQLSLRVIQKIKDYNNLVKPNKRICITRGAIMKLSGCNGRSVKKVYDTHKFDIEKYNVERNLTMEDNKKGGFFNMVKEVERVLNNG